MIQNGLVIALDASDRNSYPGTGTTWFDLSGQGNNGTLYNSPTFSTSNGGVILFDGVDDFIYCPNNFLPEFWSSAFTLETWYYVDSSETWSNGYSRCIIGRGSYAGSHGLLRTSNNNQVGMYVRGDNTSLTSVASIIRDRWYHIVGTWDGSYTKIYINGQLADTDGPVSLTGAPDSSVWQINSNMAFGGASGGFGKSTFASCKMYNKELSAIEVAQNYNALKSRFNL